MIFTGALYHTNTSFIYTSDKSSANISFVYNIKYPHLVTLSIMTNILSYSYPVTGFFNFNNLTIKSYKMTSYGLLGVLTSYNIPYSLYLASLFLWQSKYLLITFFAIFQILWIMYSFYNLVTSIIALLCPCVRFL